MDKKELTQIQNLPDYMSCDVIEAEFKKLITATQNIYRDEDKRFLLEAYFELSERQWHTHTRLNLNLLKPVTKLNKLRSEKLICRREYCYL